MKRWKHTLSHYKMVTGNMGELLPIACVPVLPGDTFQHHTQVLVRCSPLNAPVMHPTNVRIHHWFVPNRIIFPDWEQFITGGPDGNDQTSLPRVTMNDAVDKSIMTYCGASNAQTQTVLDFPMRAYNKIYNQRYRDQDLIPEKNELDNSISKVAWEKDYFSTARPWTQKGPDILLPLGDTAPVVSSGVSGPTFTDVASQTEDWGLLRQEDLDSNAAFQNGFSGAKNGTWLDPGLETDLSAATGVSVNEFRMSFALQRYAEARARYGSRFVEYLRYLGVTPSDARLQEPEYLGGGQARLNFSEVLQTANDPGQTGQGRENFGVGDMYGHGIAGVRTNRYRKFFEEHGYVITLLSVRPKALYVNGTPREFFKTTREDFFQKELAHIGQQPIYNEELYPDSDDLRNTFGFQDRYDEYRTHPSQVHGDFKDILNPYHMGRDLAHGS